MHDKPKKYLTSTQVRQRYGDRSNMWLWRMEHGADPSGPGPSSSAIKNSTTKRRLTLTTPRACG